MTASITKFASLKQYAHDGTVDFKNATIKAALVTSSYTPDYNAHSVWADVSANEVANGNGYTTGGVELANKAVDESKWDADDAAWTALTKTFRYCLLYVDDTIGSVVKPLIACVLLDTTPADISVSATNYAVQWDPDGILNWS